MVDAVIVDDENDTDRRRRRRRCRWTRRPTRGSRRSRCRGSREMERRPVIAPWLQPRRRRDRGRAVAAGWMWHATGFHIVRPPIYAAKSTARAPRGVLVAAPRHRPLDRGRGVRPAARGRIQRRRVRPVPTPDGRPRRPGPGPPPAGRRRGARRGGRGCWPCTCGPPTGWSGRCPRSPCWSSGGWDAGRPAGHARSVVRTQVAPLTSDVVIRALGRARPGRDEQGIRQGRRRASRSRPPSRGTGPAGARTSTCPTG